MVVCSSLSNERNQFFLLKFFFSSYLRKPGTWFMVYGMNPSGFRRQRVQCLFLGPLIKEMLIRPPAKPNISTYDTSFFSFPLVEKLGTSAGYLRARTHHTGKRNYSTFSPSSFLSLFISFYHSISQFCWEKKIFFLIQIRMLNQIISNKITFVSWAKKKKETGQTITNKRRKNFVIGKNLTNEKNIKWNFLIYIENK